LEYAKAKVSRLVYYEEQCYQAQQAAEKALKGLLIYYQVDPEFTHNIERLFDALSQHTELPDNVKGATKLTDYATFTRYPGQYDDITQEEYEESIVLATNCFGLTDRYYVSHHVRLQPLEELILALIVVLQHQADKLFLK
jgi:HEPN domain-containing protein